MGAANTPAYRGTAYVVFEDLPLGNYGNRIPQLSFEVFRPLADPDSAEGLTRAVTMIPASGEFAYATQGIRKGNSGSQTADNLNALTDTADMIVALDRLQTMAPMVESVSLVVSWFGNDLRAGQCQVRPKVELAAKNTTPQVWSVNGVNRASASLVSRDDPDRPNFGGTPADFTVVQAIREMKARGLRVTFYPFLMMMCRMATPCRTRIPTTRPVRASPPFHGEGGSPVHLQRAMSDRWTRPPRRPRKSRRSLAAPAR